jgi:predicted nucleic acid-binding protein
MMNVLLDTNIVLDYILMREPFIKSAKTIFKWSFEQKITAYISASALTDVYYLVRQAKDTAINFIKDLIQFIHIAAVDKSVVISALSSGFTDFEDAVQNAAAQNIGITHIVTGNIKDFKKSSLIILSPEIFVKKGLKD